MNPLYLKTNIIYQVKHNNYTEAEKCCFKILEVDHNNQFAKITLNQIEPFIKK
jgi:hypothetical protein